MRFLSARPAKALLQQQQLIMMRMFALSLLLVVDCSRHNQGQKGNNGQQERHLHHGLGDFTDENAEILNPLRQTDFVEQQEYVSEYRYHINVF
jgi:hypothetical protein